MSFTTTSFSIKRKLQSFGIKKILIVSISSLFILGGVFVFLMKVNSQPEQILASTFGANTFTVSYFTDWKAKSELVVADNPEFSNAVTFLDERDAETNNGRLISRNSHVLVARGLEPNTVYYYKVKTFLNTKYNEETYQVKTPKVSKEVRTPDPMYGEVVKDGGKPLANVLVEVFAESADGNRSTSIVTYTGSNGSYTADLANLRTFDNSDYFTLEDGIPAKVRVTARTQKEAYYHEVYDLDALTPVETFEFQSVEDDYAGSAQRNLAQHLVPDAKAADCSAQRNACNECRSGAWGDGVDCSQNCKDADECEAANGGDSQREEKKQERKESPPPSNPSGNGGNNCMSVDDYYAVCCANQRRPEGQAPFNHVSEVPGGWGNCERDAEECAKSARVHAAECSNLPSSNPPQQEPPQGDPRDDPDFYPDSYKDDIKVACTTLHQVYASKKQQGYDDCNARKAANEQAITAAPGMPGGLTCGTGEEISSNKSCDQRPPRSEESPTVSFPGCQQAAHNPNEWFRCVPADQARRNGGYNAINCAKNSKEVGYRYDNGACVHQQQAQPEPQPTPEPQPAPTQPPHEERIIGCEDGQGFCINYALYNQSGRKEYMEETKVQGGKCGGNDGKRCVIIENNSNHIDAPAPPRLEKCDGRVPASQHTLGAVKCDKGDGRLNYVCPAGQVLSFLGDRQTPERCVPENPALPDCDYKSTGRFCSGALDPRKSGVSKQQCKLQEPDGEGQMRINYLYCCDNTNHGPSPKGDGSCAPQGAAKPELPACNPNVYCPGNPAFNGATVQCTNAEGHATICCPDNAPNIEYSQDGSGRCTSNTNIPVQETGSGTRATESLGPDEGFPIELAPKVKAQQAGNVKSGDTIEPGKYELPDGSTIVIESPSKVRLFQDTNGNGIKDADEQEISNESITLIKEGEPVKYNVINGWNALNFPFFKDEESSYTAKEIMAAAQASGIEIITIKKWVGKWLEYTSENGQFFGVDFKIQPNQGYFVRSTSKGTFTITGVYPTEPIGMQLLNGWSLLGVGPGKSQQKQKVFTHAEFNDGVKAFELLKAMNKNDASIQAENVTRWDSGVYRGVNYTKGRDGKMKEFGLDFTVSDMEAYFVKSSKKTVFVP